MEKLPTAYDTNSKQDRADEIWQKIRIFAEKAIRGENRREPFSWFCKQTSNGCNRASIKIPAAQTET